MGGTIVVMQVIFVLQSSSGVSGGQDWINIAQLRNLPDLKPALLNALQQRHYYRCIREVNHTRLPQHGCKTTEEKTVMCCTNTKCHEGGESLPDFCTESCPVPVSHTDVIRKQQLKQNCIGDYFIMYET